MIRTGAVGTMIMTMVRIVVVIVVVIEVVVGVVVSVRRVDRRIAGRTADRVADLYVASIRAVHVAAAGSGQEGDHVGRNPSARLTRNAVLYGA